MLDYALIKLLAGALCVLIQFNPLKPDVHLTFQNFSSYITENKLSPLQKAIKNAL